MYVYINRISCGKVLHVALVRCNCFDEDVCDGFAGASPTQAAKARIFMIKDSTWIEKVSKKKGAKREPRNIQKHNLRNRVEKVAKKGASPSTK